MAVLAGRGLLKEEPSCYCMASSFSWTSSSWSDSAIYSSLVLSSSAFFFFIYLKANFLLVDQTVSWLFTCFFICWIYSYNVSWFKISSLVVRSTFCIISLFKNCSRYASISLVYMVGLMGWGVLANTELVSLFPTGRDLKFSSASSRSASVPRSRPSLSALKSI